MAGYGVKKVRLIKKRIFGKGHQMTCVSQPQRERGGRERERGRKRERERKRKHKRERERMKGGCRKKTWRNVMWATIVHRRLGTMSLRMTCVISFYYISLRMTWVCDTAIWHPKNICTQTRLHAEAFTSRRFYTQTLLHTDAFTHRYFYTQTLSHTDAFT